MIEPQDIPRDQPPAIVPGAAGSDFRPSLISWNLTQLCNLKCPHCYMSAGKRTEDELTTGECLSLLGEM